MTWPRGERLYHRLPEIHRRRDREQGEPLRALLAVAESQLELLEDDIAGLYENWFLETCQDWVVPYLGDLLGIRALGKPPHAGAHPRVQVGRVFDYRRRKGTPVALERVTHDVTGWFARVVELFQFLAHTQNVERLRPGQGGLFDVRRLEAVEQDRDLFAPPALFRTVDTRRIASRRGRFNIPNLALHVWRLRAFSVADAPAFPAGAAGRFFFDPLGRDVQLFNRPQVPDEVVRRADEHHLPVALRPDSVEERLADYYGAGRAFEVRVNGVPEPDIVVADLATWTAPPDFAAGEAAVDVRRGRILFATPPAGPVRVTYTYGAPAAMGGGPYDRRATLADLAAAGFSREVSLAGGGTPLADAIADWNDDPDLSPLGVIRVTDSALFTDDLEIELTAGRRLVLEAADGVRPALRPGLFRVAGGGPESGLTINGFLIDAGLEIQGSLDLLVTHTTLVPLAGRGSLFHTAGDPTELSVRLTHSFTGALLLPGDIAALHVEDGIVDAAVPGGGATPLPALVSGPLAEPIALGTRLEVTVQLGAEEATARLAGIPTGVAGAAQLLQDALRGAGAGPRFDDASVVAVGSRLLVRSGAAGEPVSCEPSPADDRTAGDLRLLTPPARFVSGLFSGPLGAFPPFNPLQLRVTLGGDGPRLLTLPASPADVAAAAALLQQAIRAASPQPLYAQATVAAIDDFLLVRPGVAGASVVFAAASEDTQTVADLQLTVPPARVANGVFAGPLGDFPDPEVQVTIAGIGPRTVILSGPATNLSQLAATLTAAILAADPPAFAGASVAVVGDRLLVRPGAAGQTVAFAGTTEDPATAGALGLLAPPAALLPPGLMSAPLSPFPAFPRPQLMVTIGGAGGGGPLTVTLQTLPADLGTAAEALQAALRDAATGSGFQNAEVLPLGNQLFVHSGTAGVTIQQAGTNPTFQDLGFDAAVSLTGRLSAPVSPFPAFPLPSVGIAFAGAEAQRAELAGFPHTVAEARTLLEAAVRSAGTGASFTAASVLALGDRLLILSGTPREEVEVTASDVDGLTWEDLGLASPPAQEVTGLLSGELFPFPILFQPALTATIGGVGGVGGVGPRPVILDRVPADLAEARTLLEAALRAAHTNARFSAAVVEVLGDRLLVQPGVAGEEITFAAAADDPNTVEDLALDQPPARPVYGLLSGDLSPFPAFPRPQVQVTMTVAGAPDGPHTASLSGLPADLDQARAQLEQAIRAARPAVPAWSGATVVRRGDRLLVQPGADNAAVTFAATAADTTTATDLGLVQPPGRQVLISGDLSTFPTLPRPRLAVTLGADGPHAAELADLPSDLADAAARLQTAIQNADASQSFVDSRVVVVGTRLLVLPGDPADTVTIAAEAADAGTAVELGLTTGAAMNVLYSGDLSPFPTLTRAAPELSVSLGAVTQTVVLSPKPTSLAAAASTLQAAIRAASAAPTFQQAQVLATPDHLIVVPGVANDPVSCAATGADAVTVVELRLNAALSFTVQGLLSPSLAPFPALSIAPAVAATLGGVGPRTARFTSIPSTLAAAATQLQAALQAAPPPPAGGAEFTGATVEVLGSRLLVIPGGTAGGVTLADTGTGPTTATGLRLTAALSRGSLLSSDLAGFSRLGVIPDVQVTLGGTTALARLADIPDDLAEAAALLQAAIRNADPGAVFTGATVEVVDATWLLVTPGVARQSVSFADPPSGPATATLLALLPAGGARILDGLLSGSTTPFSITLPPLALTAHFGGVARTVDLGAVPVDVAGLASRLQTVLRAGSPPATFANAQVFDAGDRILVLPGNPGDRVAFTAAAVSPEVVARLKLDAAGATPVTGLLSGSLAPFPVLRMEPAIVATVGGAGPATLPLGVPADLADAAARLQSALRTLDATLEVRVLGLHLLVVPSNPASTVILASPPEGPATASLLGLSAGSRMVAGLLSGPTTGVLSLTPRLQATLPTTPPATASAALGAIPDSLDTTRDLLEAAIRGAHAAFGTATVEVLGDRLVLRSPAGVFTLADDLTGQPAATLLGFIPGERADGLLSGPLPGFAGIATVRPTFQAAFGGEGPFRITLPGVPADLAQAAVWLETELRAASITDTFVEAEVEVVGSRLLITPGVARDAAVFTAVPGREADLERLGLDAAHLVPAGGLLSGELSSFALRGLPRLVLEVGADSYGLVLPAFPAGLADAASLLQAAVRAADSSFAAATVEVVEGRLLVSLGVPDPFHFEADPADALSVVRLGLDTGRTIAAGGLLSGSLAPFPVLAARPAVGIQIGDEGPYPAFLPSLPATREEARAALEEAIRRAHTSPAFYLARVALTGDGRLVVLPGLPAQVVASPADVTTVDDLKLRGAESAQVGALLSGPLPAAVDLTDPAPAVRFELYAGTAALAFEAGLTVAAGPVPVSDLAGALNDAIAAAQPFTPPAPPIAWVVQSGSGAESRLAAVPSGDGVVVRLSTAPADTTTVGELGFDSARAFGTGAGDEPGPPLSLERVTVLGRVTVRELNASAALFSEPVRAERRHVGCVRYSYLPEGSETPRRFRCQPDLAVARAVQRALEDRLAELGWTSPLELSAEERDRLAARARDRVAARLVPRFVSRRFGDPGYARLAPETAPEILTGAGDGAEMGAWSSLEEPLRRAQLAILIEEYLRFGVDAGVFHVPETL